MANIPLIPAAQQTYSRFKRQGRNQPVESDDNNKEQPIQSKRSLKHRLGDRRKRNLRVRLDRRYNQDRRRRQSDNLSKLDGRKNAHNIGRHINTTA